MLLGLAIAGLMMFPMLSRLLFGGGVAATPAVFVNTPRLSEALVRAGGDGKPLVVFATADWCPPCQAMKRETLIDPRVVEIIQARSTPVYVNVDHDPDAAKLGIFGIPATLVIVGGTTVARHEGYLDAKAYATFLSDSLDLAGKPDEVERIRREAKPR